MLASLPSQSLTLFPCCSSCV